MPGEREVNSLLEVYWRSECLIGDVKDKSLVETPSGREAYIFLSGENEDMLSRVILVRDRGLEMFPDFLIGKRIRVLVRRTSSDDWTTWYRFSSLAHVEGLTISQQRRLWPWRLEALDVLRNRYVQLSDFEEDLCGSLSVWGNPPSDKQRRIFREISARKSHPARSTTLDAALRASRHKPRPSREEPTDIAEALQELLEELRQIWLESRRI